MSGLRPRRPCGVLTGWISTGAAAGLYCSGRNTASWSPVALGRPDLVEADAGVDRQVLRHAPVVLDEPLDVGELRVGDRVAGRLRVALHRPDQRVGERVVGVQRVVGVAVEVEGAVELAAARRRPRRVLEEQAGLQVVRAGDLGQVDRAVPDVVLAEERIAAFDAELRQVGQREAGRRRSWRWGRCCPGWPRGRTAAARSGPTCVRSLRSQIGRASAAPRSACRGSGRRSLPARSSG